MADLGELLGGIINDGVNFGKDQLVELINNAKADEEQFIKDLGSKLEKYIRQLANGDIDKDEFESLVKGLANLQKIKTAQLSAAAKVRAEKIAVGIQNIIVDSLLKVLKL